MKHLRITPNRSTLQRLFVACGLLAASAPAGAQNLLTNFSFESGLSGWDPVASAAHVLSYGSSGAPSLQMASVIAGGNRLLADLAGGGSIIEQTVVTGPIPPGSSVEASGYFGGLGASEDTARLEVIFLDGSDQELGRRFIGGVSAGARNQEDVLLFRRGLFVPPQGTEKLVARVELTNPCCGGATALADHLYLGLTTEPLIPPGLPLHSNLLENSTFEDGWSFGSPLSLTQTGGWEGTVGRTRVRFYSDSDPSVPSSATASIVGGGAALLTDLGDGGLRQVLDVRGNAADLSQGLDLLVSAFEGGVGTTLDTARVELQFLNEFFVPVGAPTPPLGPVTSAMRNFETVVMKRERRFTVPPQTAFITVAIAFADPCCGMSNGMIDNVSASLVEPVAPAPQPLLVNVVRNGNFEAGSLPGSPLQLTDPRSWIGSSTGQLTVTPYGANSEVPGPAFSQMNGLGGLVLDDLTGGGALQQSFDLRGMETLISQGVLTVSGSVWLGGAGPALDVATARLQFLNDAGVQVGLLRQLGPVTAADRMNQTTLLRRAESFTVPLGAKSLTLTVEMTDVCCGPIAGLADGIELIFSDGSTFGERYCTANPNSTGARASVAALGSDVVAMNSMTLAAGGLPAQAFAFFVASRTQGFVPNPAGSSGNLCLGGSIGRFVGPNQIQQANGLGNIYLDIDLTVIPTPLGFVSGAVGDSWNFQAWYRDALGSGATSNFTDGVRVVLR